jgi:hypothetical protein
LQWLVVAVVVAALEPEEPPVLGLEEPEEE